MIGCASAPTDPGLLSVVKPLTPGSAKIVTDPYHTSNDSFFVIDEGPCERSWIGNYVTKVIYTRFQPEPDGTLAISVKSENPVSIGFNYGISDKSCDVRGTFIPVAGKIYAMDARVVFQGALIPVSTGCTLQMVDDATREVVPLMASTIRERVCTPQP